MIVGRSSERRLAPELTRPRSSAQLPITRPTPDGVVNSSRDGGEPDVQEHLPGDGDDAEAILKREMSQISLFMGGST